MRPRWKLVWLFYGLAFGWVSLVAVGLFASGMGDLGAGAKQIAMLALAFLYMPAPLVAALVVERVAGDRPLIRFTFQRFGRKLLRLIGTALVVLAAWLALDIVLVWVLGNVLQVPGVGSLASTSQQIVANVRAAIGPGAVSASAAAQMPAPVVLIAIALASGLAAGLSVNGLFAFGEEYGWRGWLMNELRSLGEVKANVLTGAMWGFWHAPVILLGFNYGPYRLVGPLMMMVFCIPLSFVLWRARDFTGSLLAPAIIHGGMNASAGFFLFLVGSGNHLVRVPVGLLGAVSFGLVATGLWAATRGRLRDTVDPERSEPELAVRANPAGGINV